MKPDFNFIAPFYDDLAFIVYGRKLIDARMSFIHRIPAKGRVLLMGGGTGKILNQVLKQVPGITIDFVEPAEKMIHLAQRNLESGFKSQVNFICGDHHSIPHENEYDVATSFFVIDCFRQEKALEFVKAITLPLKGNGLLLFSDFFYTGKFRHRALIWFMYRFFKLTAGVETQKLPDYDRIFETLGLQKTEEKVFLSGLIRSGVFLRSSI